MGVHGATRHQYHGTTWTTPRDFYDGVAARYGPFTLDAAASHDNALAATYYTEEDDGLRQPWPGRVWCNPPYGRKHNAAWAERAARATREREAEIVALLVPVATETTWWQEHIFQATEIHFITPRLRFGGRSGGGTFASALAIYKPGRIGAPTFYRMNARGEPIPWPKT